MRHYVALDEQYTDPIEIYVEALDSAKAYVRQKALSDRNYRFYIYNKINPELLPSPPTITETIDNDDLDALIIHVGLNSLQTKSDQEIVQGILDMVHLCHQGGIKDVLVSGLTYKEGYEANIRNINELLKK